MFVTGLALPDLFLLTAVTLLWLLSLRLRDAGIVDVFWGLGFVICLLAWVLSR